jgi:predicted nucleic acid-binding protein
MIIVADTSPLNYLILIGNVDVLPTLFGEVTIPAAVLRELNEPKAPAEVRDWLASPPPWLILRSVTSIAPSLSDLDEGEQEALSLAIEIVADLVLIDDAHGREAARRMGLNLTGTLGVLVRAADAQLLDLPSAIARLRDTTFHVSPHVFEEILRRHHCEK